MSPAYLDPRTGQTFPLEQPRWCGTSHAPLLLTPLPGIARGQIDTATRSLSRYRAALPMQVDDPITLGEGCTPLLRRTLHGAPALLKCEWFMPTGSFKDRGACVRRRTIIHRVSWRAPQWYRGRILRSLPARSQPMLR
jgi:threonine synthase